MKGASYAWVVVVPGDECVPEAVLTSLSIKTGLTMGSTIALIPDRLSSSSIGKLNSGFDMVIISNVDKSLNSISLKEFLILECWKVTSFTTVVALHPGVIPARGTGDAAFDFEQGILEGSRSNLYGVVVKPCKRLHAKLQSSFLTNIDAGNLPSVKSTLETIKICSKVGCVVTWEDLESRDDERDFNFLFFSLSNFAEGDTARFNETQQHLWHVYTKWYLPLIKPYLDFPPVAEDMRDWVAVIGMGCRFPDSNNPNEYWDMLANGRNTCGPLPPYRIPLLSSGSTPILANYLKCNITEFDAGFFGMSPSEAAFTDPQQRMLLEVSWEAFEDAGINPEGLRGSSSGVFHGGWTQEYRDCFNEYSPPAEEYTRKYCGNGLGSAAAKLSLFYGFTGPNVAAESACSSSMVAVEMAVKSLQQRECPVAIATGTSLLLHLTPKGQVWSPEGISRTFDAKANGYGRAEGIAVLIMKRFCDAARDGDRMYGVIRGCGVSQEGLSRSFGSPTVESEVFAMKKAMENARVSPNQVDYVEAHATGTNVGDPVEATAICEAYKSFDGIRKKPLFIASGKTNIGHSESSSGMAGMFKTLLALKNETIPPHINFTEMNPKISFESIPGQVPVTAVPWPRENDRARIAGVSGFGITGTDVHIIVQEAPKEQSIVTKETLPLHVVSVSGKNEKALEQASNNLLQYLESTGESIANIAYTSTACRYHHSFRTAYLGQSIPDIITQLKNNRGLSAKVKLSPKIAFVFSAEAPEDFAHVASLHKTCSIFRFYFNHCDALVQRVTGQCLIGALHQSPLATEGLKEICIIAAQWALAKMWMALGVMPEVVVGKHFGEIVAAIITGVIHLEQAIEMVSQFQSGNASEENFMQILKNNSRSKNRIEFISGVSGTPLKRSEMTANYFIDCMKNDDKHLTQVITHLEMDATVEIKFGPNSSSGISHVLQTMSQLHVLGVDLNWNRLYENVAKVKVSLPTYPFQRKSYWFDKTESVKESKMRGVKIHPLIGCSIENASDVGIFQNDLTSKEQLPYLYDHCITSEVIYPAAAHLEAILGAGCNSLNSAGDTQNFIRRPPYPVQIENFCVHQPLHVLPSVKTKIQTVVKPSSDGSYVVSVHGLKPSDKCWREYATGTFSPVQSNENSESIEKVIDLQKVLKSCPESSEALSQFYQNTTKVGLQFGPKFQSLQKIYSGQSETLAELAPECYDAEYLCHPVAIDAMLQLFIYHTMPQLKKLHVPVKIAKLILYPRTEETGRLFAYCKSESGGVTSKVYLVDGDGNIVAVMVHPVLIATTAQSVLDAAGCNLTSALGIKLHPSLYEQFWKSGGTLGNFEINRIPFPEPNMSSWLILHYEAPEISEIVTRFEQVGRKCVAISLTSLETMCNGKLQDEIDRIINQHKNSCEGLLFIATSQITDVKQGRQLVEPLLCISKNLLKSRQKVPKFNIVTRGSWHIEDEVKVHKMNPMLATIWGYMRTLRAEMPTISSQSIDLDPDLGDEVNSSESAELIQEIFEDNKENEVVFRSGKKYFRRLKNLPGSHTLLEFPDACKQFTVLLPETKVLQDLKYVSKSPGIVKENQIEIEIRSSALNFKDVFNVMKPTKEFDSMNTIGLDYAGVVTRIGGNSTWKVGDRVFGCTFDQGSIASHIVADARFITGIPPQMTFTEAATLPAVFLTAWYCMVNIARVQRGQTILVHAASGGVGLVAIQIAKYLGVNVIGTAGSSRKRNFVKSVGIQNVFNSRNLDYGQQTKEVTQGQGVDMVLNCLTGPGFKETSLDILKDGGHFVEIGKVDIWSSNEVARRRSKVNYNVVYMPDVAIDIVGQLVLKMGELIRTKDIVPLPVVTYPGAYLVDALVYLQKAKQIGKVVVEMPVATKTDGGMEWREQLFNEYSTYLITGGFGDIGMAVANWMVSKGATNLCLVSRRAPTGDVTSLVQKLNEQGATVLTRQCDIGDYNECRQLLEGLSHLPPVRGVHHCAGVIQDGTIGKQEWASFDKVYKPKVDGSWNLHQLTRNMRLEFFVCYSSLTSTFGNVGQANYTGANAFMDSLVELRHAQGLKALGVNWGQWDAGMAKGLELYSAIPFSIQEGIAALEKLMKENKLNATAADVNFRNLLVQCSYLKDNLLADMDLKDTEKSEKASEGKTSTGNSVREMYASCGDDEEKTKCIQSLVASVAGKILGLTIEDIDVEVNLSDIGMDSMMSIEFTNLLQVQLGDVAIGFVDMDEDGSVERLTEIIREVLDSQVK